MLGELGVVGEDVRGEAKLLAAVRQRLALLARQRHGDRLQPLAQPARAPWARAGPARGRLRLTSTCGGVPRSTRMRAVSAIMASTTVITSIEETAATGSSSPSSRTQASPSGAPVSITTSATSYSFLPEECRE